MEPMQPKTLEYFTPARVSDRWRGVLFVWVFGALTGAAIEIAQTSAALFCWVANGRPDYYFRGRSGVEIPYEILQALRFDGADDAFSDFDGGEAVFGGDGGGGAACDGADERFLFGS